MFLTAKAEMEQTEKDGIWRTLHNQLFMDVDGQIYLVPRNYLTDGYTIPSWIAWLGGGKMQWDIRPSIGHDFECQYHQELVVKLKLEELSQKGFLRNHTTPDNKVILVCDNIPAEFLELRNTTFKNVNAKFLRMMQATRAIKAWRSKLMFGAVHLNVGWLASGKKPFDLSKIYQ